MRDAGVSRGGGLPIVRDLQRQLKEVHAATVAAMRARRPQWTEALLQRKRLKKAGGRPLDSIPTQERERLEHNTTRMQRAQSLLANFTHEINSSIASPEREVVCT